jgi:hypothetical protein
MKIKPRKNSKPAPPLNSFNAQKFLDTAAYPEKSWNIAEMNPFTRKVIPRKR